ncbi:uroporphyrinogen-III synthase [Flavobacteriaceae bacterium]|nr:uroporphyrinogen-III synthase [Flavobacteriaceae bacterium]MDA9015374.1 uroporphyrinogen-III synthase [Flavobacteriaceae bacterium]MDB3862894.1 uroporphyrinogen-III synthase [Flavobacteriaceae bacterium]MDC3354473.1 uroporphyrinogen-III synthase [Flavobacteriaceae bacterium]
MRLLATKKLSLALKDRLIQHEFSLVEHSFIQIEPLPFQIKETQEYFIFTSQNAVKIAFSDPKNRALLEGKNYFCVGEKTKSILDENDQKVIKIAQNSAELAQFLAKNYKNEAFLFFCGKRRRPEIETFFSENNPSSEVIELYDTLLTPKTLVTNFDGILFFSPSAVSSYVEANSWNPKSHGFCIGKTTASALENYTQNFSIAKKPNETELFLSIHNYYTQHHAQK